MSRPDSRQWITAKAEGDRAELAIAGWFRGRGYETYKTLGLAGFDLLLQCQVEVKHDLKAAQTGNVAIETRHSGQPSGIMTTTATWWVIVLEGEAIIVKADTLRDFVLTGHFREVSAGDNRASAVRLVPVDRLKKIKGCKVIELEVTEGSDA
jgi:hypothetical protein